MPATKKALCIGINYTGTDAELRGSVNDALNWTDAITRQCGFWKSNVVTMIDEYPSGEQVEDDDPNYTTPTKDKIMEALEWLVKDASGGDCIFFTFSGHAAQVPDIGAGQGSTERLCEAICPLDWEEFEWGVLPCRLIPFEDVIHRYFAQLPAGVLLTVCIDAAVSGPTVKAPLLLDFEYPDRELDNEPVAQGEYCSFRMDHNAWLRSQHVNALPRRLPWEPRRPMWSPLLRFFAPDAAPPLDEGVAVFGFAACRGAQSALDASLDGYAQGVMTYCLLRAMDKMNYRCTYLELGSLMDSIAHDLRVEMMPYLDQFFQLSYGKNAGPDECLLFDPTSAFVAKDKARRRRGQRHRAT